MLLKLAGLCFTALELAAVPTSAQTFYGRVRNRENNQPVSYASIRLAGSRSASSADRQGAFTAKPPGTAPAQLIISATGYQADTLLVSGPGLLPDVFLTAIPDTLATIVFTGVSRAMSIRETPAAMALVTQKAIERTTASNIIDVLVKQVPGLNAVKTGPNISKPFIRGLGYNRVLTLFDGVRQEGQQWGDEHGLEVDGYNLGRAEVIKGPASLLYGSDALAGVVSLTPVMPCNAMTGWHGKWLSEFQHNNGLAGNGVALTYRKNNWSAAFRGAYRIARNYSNRVDGRVYNTGFRETNASATLQHNSARGYSNLNLTLYDNLQGIPDGSRDSLTRRFTQQVEEGSLDDVQNRPLVNDDALNGYALSPLHQHIRHYRLYSNSHYRLNKGEIDLNLAVQQNIRQEYNHPTLPQQPGMYVRLNTENYSLRYTLPVLHSIELTTGINGMLQQNRSLQATDFPIPDYQLFDAGSFLLLKWKKNELTVSGGVRYDVRHLSGTDFYSKTDPATGFDRQVGSGDNGGTLNFPAFSKLFTGTSLSAGASYQWPGGFTLKANIARGYRAPGITELSANGLDPGAHIIYLGNRNFTPEFSLQEDIGLLFSNRNLSASASVFNNNISHYISLSQVVDAAGTPLSDAQGNHTFRYGQGEAQLYGAELSGEIHPPGLAGFSFSNALSVVYGFNRDARYNHKGTGGAYLPLIPPAKLLSVVSQTLRPHASMFTEVTGSVEWEFAASQDRYLALNNTETMTPAYNQWSASLLTTLALPGAKTLQLHLAVSNLLNSTYQSGLSRLKYFEYYHYSPNGHYGLYNMGSNISARAILSF